VTGTGRSGTSAVARVLHESGINMGQEFAGPSPQNARGYYEDLRVAAINDKIFTDCGLRLSDSLPSRLMRKARQFVQPSYRPLGRNSVSRAEVLVKAASYRREMRELASQVPSPGGWKGTHLCLTLEAWLPYFLEKPRLVLCLRSPAAVAGSALDYFGLSDQEAREWTMQLWRNQYERLLEVIQDFDLECITIEYDDLIEHTATVVERLSAFVGHPLDPGFVEPDLRHQRGEVPPEFAGLYARVKAASAG
jgi:hypothetical protein